MSSVNQQAVQLIKTVTDSVGGDKGLVGRILRKAAKLATPSTDLEDVKAACTKALEDFGTVPVRLAAQETGCSMRKCREAFKALGAKEVIADTFTAA